MRLLLIISTLLLAVPSFACSLEVTSENLLGYSGSSACVNISNVKNDARGNYRVMDFEETTAEGETVPHSALALRPGMTRVLKQVEVPGVGVMNVIVMKAVSINTAILSFLNGNVLTLQVDANGRVTPEKICVQQSGVTQVRGFSNRCP
jgi:hypothetical protein